MTPDSQNKSNQHGIYIGNREIYDMVMKIRGQVTVMWVTNGIFMAVITAVIVNGVSG